MMKQLQSEFAGLKRNLYNSIRLLFFRRVPIGDFNVSLDQSLLLIFFYAGVTFSGSYCLSLPRPQMNIYGFSGLTTHVFFLFLAAYSIAKMLREDELTRSFFVVLMALWPWFYLIWLLIGKNSNFSYWELTDKENTVYLVYNLGIAAITINAVAGLSGIKLKNSIIIGIVYLAVIAVPLHYLGTDEFWYQNYEEEEASSKYDNINQENTYYRQFGLIEKVKKEILPERADFTDIYFIGFGSDAEQNVFMKEVKYARELFDLRFGTSGRSVALINNVETVENVPLASKTNLDMVLEQIGQLMNPEEDILFLYLTSHGSDEHELTVDLVPLDLNSINPHDLKTSLNKAGIKYRVLLVSACYSGGFVEPLKDDNSIIFTAAAADRKSFGCGYESEFTYFGQAIFQEHLKHNDDFIDAFQKAIESIQVREQNEELEPSGPQLYIGTKIKEKLQDFKPERKAL